MVLRLGATLLVALFCWVQSSIAQEAPPPSQRGGESTKSINFTNGSYQFSVHLDVPKFRGLEPDLSLSYSSARRIGGVPGFGAWAGVGWDLDGVPVIQRSNGAWYSATAPNYDVSVSAGKGAPHYDWTDWFLLDGQELVACWMMDATAQASAPSCSTGGNYTARQENYLKESFWYDPATGHNEWYVYQRDGTMLRFDALAAGNAGDAAYTYRWGLSEVTDTSGNKVKYTWYCGSSCVISEIKYFNAGSTSAVGWIIFYYDWKPTAIASEATGKATISTTAVLRTVRKLTLNDAGAFVEAGAYRLEYEDSPNTKIPRLISVQQYGTDVALNSQNGFVTGGTALPATLFTYTDTTSAWASGLGVLAYRNSSAYVNEYAFADIDGDGRDNPISSFYSSGPAASTCTYPKICSTTAVTTQRFFGSGNFFGDNKEEIVVSKDTSDSYYGGIGRDAASSWASLDQSWEFRNWNGSSYVTSAKITLPQVRVTRTDVVPTAKLLSTGDFNADGFMDAIADTDIYLGGASTITKATGWWVPLCTWYDSPANCANRKAGIDSGDFNGDGKADLLVYRRQTTASTGSSDIYGTVFVSTGLTFVQSGPSWFQISNDSGKKAQYVADVNGDGKSDIIALTTSGASTHYYTQVSHSTGNGFELLPKQEHLIDRLDTGTAVVADLNSDGRQDMLLQYSALSSGKYMAIISNGSGFALNTAWTAVYGPPQAGRY